MEKSLMMLLAEEDEAVKEYNVSYRLRDNERLTEDKQNVEDARLAIAEYLRKLTKY